MLTLIIAPLILLGALIFFHELGHFLACRLTGVRVERFSIGFGPQLFSYQGRETLYRVALFPLGGYVKPLGEEPGEKISPEDYQRSLPAKSAPARFFIFIAGTLANLLLPIPIFFLIAILGQPTVAPEIGTVNAGSPAESAGLKTGDLVISADQEKIRSFEELIKIIEKHPGQEILVQLERQGKELAFSLTPELQEGRNLLGEPVREGDAGILPGEISSRVGISSGSPAEKAGLKTSDTISQVGPTGVNTFREMRAEMISRSRSEKTLSLKVQRGKNQTDLSLNLPLSESPLSEKSWADLGILAPELFISDVLPDSPASRAGFRSGDRILSADGKTLSRWEKLVEIVQAGGTTPRQILVEREGKLFNLSVTPEAETAADSPREKSTFRIGIRSYLEYTPGRMIKLREKNPIKALVQATGKTVDFSYLTVRGIVSLIQGRISWKNVGSPILIVKLAGDSARSGWYPYLFLLIIISINLGILNMLPIPIFDGGQILLLLVEVIIRHPLSLKTREITQQIGFALVLLIMALAVYNDLVRFQDDIVNFFKRWF
ncbi:MAG: RIP metalloprotease RseP [Proteobacteria bacterium]|jgi:regulator of sigma E protease|nr:RIP metalloprotease RseP [Pseudomonadota bacterium]